MEKEPGYTFMSVEREKGRIAVLWYIGVSTDVARFQLQEYLLYLW